MAAEVQALFIGAGLLATTIVAGSHFIMNGVPRFLYRRPYVQCDRCGKDVNDPAHDGFNGYFADQNMACR